MRGMCYEHNSFDGWDNAKELAKGMVSFATSTVRNRSNSIYRTSTLSCSLRSPPLTINTPQPSTADAAFRENFVHLYHRS